MNVARRHLNKGQKAMTAAIAREMSKNDKSPPQVATEANVASGYVGMAEVVRQYARNLANRFLAGLKSPGRPRALLSLSLTPSPCHLYP